MREEKRRREREGWNDATRRDATGVRKGAGEQISYLLSGWLPACLPACLHLNRIVDAPAHRISMRLFVTIATLFTPKPLRGKLWHGMSSRVLSSIERQLSQPEVGRSRSIRGGRGKKNFIAIHVDYVDGVRRKRRCWRARAEMKRGKGGTEVMVVDRFFLDTNGAISKKIFVVFADNKYRRT